MDERNMHEETVSTNVIDMVCGMELNLRPKMLRSTYSGETYYFCSANCKEHFDNAPERYAVTDESQKELL